ncbi:HD domain-containing phosphohydrolase [Hippea maritima]|uniref:Metal dependent phosphohydrolase with GAF sensor n=1 Tax=Hippea maritima (strain ATCC 700847 / DSM 10411 / MH2) TaxID=760142 RepID=F2LU12_HIPMA|nr:HD domain-containing phosphohydrolase [Hippea maritima]AEA33411.1 metal dependent phosphohydrolase with GAF sensor [Hippea maritima DSM 10411]
MSKQEQFLKIIEGLHNCANRRDGWSPILKNIAEFFNVSSAFFAEIIDENVMECYSSEEEYNNCKIPKMSVASETIKTKDSIVVMDYENSKYSDGFWSDKGVKCIASVPVIFSDRVFGALQLVRFDESKKFSARQLELLKAIARVMSFALYYHAKAKSTDTILSLMLKEFEFFYNQKLPDYFDKIELERWISSYLKNILNITKATAVGFVFPEENIYAVVNKTNNNSKNIFYTDNDEVKDWILYKMWEKSIGDVIEASQLEDYGITHSNLMRNFQIKSALFVPVKYNDRVIVAMGFGFSEPINIDHDFKLALQNSAAHLAFMLVAAKNLSTLNNKLIDTEESFLESFILMMEARDVYTKGHSKRVALYAKAIAKALGYSQKDQDLIYLAGILHDIGKIGIPDNILLKPGKLTPNEYRIIKNHAEFSYQIIKNIKKFEDIAEFVRYHHERCDGSGYPKGLMCDEIPEGARILAIADVFDAITSTRPYRKKLSVDRALDVLIEMGKGLDQSIVAKVLEVLRESYYQIEDYQESREFVPEEIEEIRKRIFTTDYMTGLLRRKQFIEKASKYIDEHRKFWVFYFDIKNLSYLNYSYSMDIGDKIIIHTAEALKSLKEVKLLARVEPDAFYFVYESDIEPAVFAVDIKKHVKAYVTEQLSKEEFFMSSWRRVINYYVSFSEYIPGKTVEQMMYECKQKKKEFEEMLL